MILITANEVHLKMDDGAWIEPPASYGLIHDPDGETLDRCYLYVGPYKKLKRAITPTNESDDYFGKDTRTFAAVVDVPYGPWNPLGHVTQILYKRPGKYKGKYFHDFDESVPVMLSECDAFMRLSLPTSCEVNWRGIVYP